MARFSGLLLPPLPGQGGGRTAAGRGERAEASGRRGRRFAGAFGNRCSCGRSGGCVLFIAGVGMRRGFSYRRATEPPGTDSGAAHCSLLGFGRGCRVLRMRLRAGGAAAREA